jgi:hypothetical protein
MKIRPFVVLAALLAFASASPLSSSDPVGVLVPREVFVGDAAELSFSTGALNAVLKPGAEETVPSDDVAVSHEVTVESVTVRRGESSSTVVIRFVPWYTGLVRLPPFAFGKVRVVPPPVRVSSLSERTGTSSLEPPRPPLVVPGTTFALYALAASGLVAFIALAVAIARLRRFLSLNGGRLRSGRRSKLALRELKWLERRVERLPGAEWYAAFSLVLRRYLGSFLGNGPSALLSATTREIAAALAERAETVPEAIRCRVGTLLSAIDAARYSGREPTASPRDAIAEARAAVLALEETARAVLAEREASDVQL